MSRYSPTIKQLVTKSVTKKCLDLLQGHPQAALCASIITDISKKLTTPELDKLMKLLVALEENLKQEDRS